MGSRRRIVCFGLPQDCSEKDIDEIFGKYGKILQISCKFTYDGAMAFIEYADSRDAQDALDERHGYVFVGNKLRVEFTRDKGEKGEGKGDGKGKKGSWGGKRGDSRGGKRNDSRGKGGRYDSRGRKGKGKGKSSDGKGKGKGLRENYHKVRVMGMPPTASWQDLKDFLRKAGNVKFTEIVAPGIGVGGYETLNEARDAILDLDGKRLGARNGDSENVTLEEERDGPKERNAKGRNNSRSVGRQRSRSASRKPRSRSRRRSSDRKPERSSSRKATSERRGRSRSD